MTAARVSARRAKGQRYRKQVGGDQQRRHERAAPRLKVRQEDPGSSGRPSATLRLWLPSSSSDAPTAFSAAAAALRTAMANNLVMPAAICTVPPSMVQSPIACRGRHLPVDSPSMVCSPCAMGSLTRSQNRRCSHVDPHSRSEASSLAARIVVDPTRSSDFADRSPAAFGGIGTSIPTSRKSVRAGQRTS